MAGQGAAWPGAGPCAGLPARQPRLLSTKTAYPIPPRHVAWRMAGGGAENYHVRLLYALPPTNHTPPCATADGNSGMCPASLHVRMPYATISGFDFLSLEL